MPSHLYASRKAHTQQKQRRYEVKVTGESCLPDMHLFRGGSVARWYCVSTMVYKKLARHLAYVA